MLLQQGNNSPADKDNDENIGIIREYQNINPDIGIGRGNPATMSNDSLESAKYKEMCKFYCSPYNVTTKSHHPSNNPMWRHGRRINNVGHLKPLPKLVKFKDDNVEDEIVSTDYENMDANLAVTKWSEKKFTQRSPKATGFKYTNGSITDTTSDGDLGDEDRMSLSETIRSTPTDSTSETNTQDYDSVSTKSRKSKKKVQFVGIENHKKHFTPPCTKGKKSNMSKGQRPLQAVKLYAYVKDEKTGKLPVIYEEKGVLPPIVEKYTTNVTRIRVSQPCIGDKYQMAAKRWRSVYDKIRPTNHMKTFTEVVYAVRAQMDELKAARGFERSNNADDYNGDGKQGTVKIVKTSIMQTPTVQRINANGVKMYPIDTDQGVPAECT